ncbi:GNAT family N-acetyltransferase [Massilia sp. W12]|uniref:GNAT family N-acetyltransferase n=1 Tax=Massilia sp. W12 TaxID=3126507 RepID=UPI0030CE98F6
MSTELLLQRAQMAHLEAMLDLRMALFAEGGILTGQSGYAQVRQANHAYFSRHLDDQNCVSWVVTAQDQVVACGSLALFQRPPYPGNLHGREAYLLNMMTLPAWRRRGAARMVLQAALAEARLRDCPRVWLHASEDGRSLYQEYGFIPVPAFMEATL